MNVVVLTTEPFPIGMAATNRILSYAKGLKQLSHEVNLICLEPTEQDVVSIRNKSVKGEYEGIHFEYSSGTTIWAGSKLTKLYLVLKGVVRAWFILRRMQKKRQISALILVSNKAYYMFYFYFLSRILGIKYIQEKSEYPFVLNKKTIFGKIYANIYVNYFYRLFDGMIIMTKPLHKYYKARTRSNAQLIIVPMTVEPERFLNNTLKIQEESPYIAYCGFMGGNKDGVEALIDAFIRIADDYKNLKLYLIGSTYNQQEADRLLSRVVDAGLKERVVFTGMIGRSEMPAYLCGASILALARPSCLQSHGGFPTKLGEYLSTGKPVVVTRVGTISDYLEDGVSAFIAEPDSVESFAEKLKYALSNSKLSDGVGLQGQQVALNEFNYKVQSKRIADYIGSLNDT